MKSYNSCPAQDMKLVIGDFNAKIGKELFISSNAGLHSLLKETNENGQRLWDFAVSENLFIISTAFPHKEIHKYTWISPDGQTHNQIDHVLIDRRHRNNIMDEIILKSANETVTGLERRARNEWYDEDCRKATEMKNKAYLQLLRKHCTRTHEEKYRKLRKAEKKLLRRKKKSFSRIH
ncbi:uncharacterized protein TNCV_1079491 [Trichonephila clavipes]|nr:uncharacterized protein TNCV_1079491 [Trichonephila clavipes]